MYFTPMLFVYCQFANFRKLDRFQIGNHKSAIGNPLCWARNRSYVSSSYSWSDSDRARFFIGLDGPAPQTKARLGEGSRVS
jgi:hypothetical protein